MQRSFLVWGLLAAAVPALLAPPGWARPLAAAHLSGLPPRPHGVHLHGSGNCDTKTQYVSAGPISQLGNLIREQGYLAEDNPQASDLLNQFAGTDCRLHASVVASGFALDNGKRSIFDHHAVTVGVDRHDDDYSTRPLRSAGTRIACGVVVRTEVPLPPPPMWAKPH